MKLNLKSLALCAAMLSFGFADNPYFVVNGNGLRHYTNVTPGQLQNLNFKLQRHVSENGATWHSIEATYGRFTLRGTYTGEVLDYYLIDNSIRYDNERALWLNAIYKLATPRNNNTNWIKIQGWGARNDNAGAALEGSANRTRALNAYGISEEELVTLSRSLIERIDVCIRHGLLEEPRMFN